MTGISEILVLLLLLACILILPRILKGVPAKTSSTPAVELKKLNVKARIGIVFSFFYPVAAGLYIRPWEGAWVLYLSFGLFPVLLCWGIAWVLAAKK